MQNFWRDIIYELSPWLAQAIWQNSSHNFVSLLGSIRGLVYRFCPSSAWYLSFTMKFWRNIASFWYHRIAMTTLTISFSYSRIYRPSDLSKEFVLDFNWLFSSWSWPNSNIKITFCTKWSLAQPTTVFWITSILFKNYRGTIRWAVRWAIRWTIRWNTIQLLHQHIFHNVAPTPPCQQCQHILRAPHLSQFGNTWIAQWPFMPCLTFSNLLLKVISVISRFTRFQEYSLVFQCSRILKNLRWKTTFDGRQP